MTVTLEAMLRRASKEAEKMFKKCGYIEMCWIVDTEADGMVGVMSMPVDSGASKDVLAAGMRELFKKMGATRYVMVCEAWTLKQGEISREEAISTIEDAGGTISNMPGRLEIVWLNASDGHELLFATREIIRPAKGKPYLGTLDLTRNPPNEGRWENMLPIENATSH
jgi:hypothetical protein